MSSPNSVFASVALFLFGAKDPALKHPDGPTPINRGKGEEVLVYTSDTLELVIKNYGLVPLAADLPSEALEILGWYFDYLMEHPYEEIDGCGLTGFATFGTRPT